MSYQLDYSRNFPAVKDEAVRSQKAIKIVRSVMDYFGREDLSGLTCLDLGCSVGVMSKALVDAGAVVVGLDIDEAALPRRVDARRSSLLFVVGDGGAVPFPDETFDLIICSQVYEHVPSLGRLTQQIHRLLNKGGMCFFSGPNRWAIIEEHYHLPLLSWLPKKWADSYVRISGRATGYYERPLSAGELRCRLQDFTIRDLTPDLLKYPENYGMESRVGPIMRRLARHIPDWSWPLIGRLVPNFNWLLTKSAT